MNRSRPRRLLSDHRFATTARRRAAQPLRAGLTCHDNREDRFEDRFLRPFAAALFAIRSGARLRRRRTRSAAGCAAWAKTATTRTCQRLRDGRLPAEGLAFCGRQDGKLVGTVRLWHVAAGGRSALVLGPLAVDPDCRESSASAAP